MGPRPFDLLAEPLGRRRLDVGVALVAASVAQAIGIPLALLTRRLVDLSSGAAAPGADQAVIERRVLAFGLGLVGLALVRGASRWQQGVRSERIAQGVIADLRNRMFAHLQRLSLGYYDRRAPGQTIVRFVGDAGSLRGWIDRVLIAAPADAFTVLAVFVAMGFVAWELLLVAAVPPLVLLPALAVINPRARRLTREGRREQARLSGELTHRLGQLGPLKAAGAEAASEEAVGSRIEGVRDSFARRGRLDATSRAISLTVGSVSLAGIGMVGSYQLLHGTATAGDIVAAVWLTLLIRGPVNRLTQANVIHQRARVALERIASLLERTPEPGWDQTLEAYTGAEMRVRFKNLGYREQSGLWPVRGFTGTIEGPGLVLLAGDVEASRVVFELMLRLRRPHEGRVALDHVNAKKLRVPDIRSRIGWVDHDRAIVWATLAAGKREAVARAWPETDPIDAGASLEDAIAGFEGEGRMPAGARGAVGMRLALACAIAEDRPIVLVDEPTAGLDPTEASRVLWWLASEARERLVIVASSDPRVLDVATRVVEVGPPRGSSAASS